MFLSGAARPTALSSWTVSISSRDLTGYMPTPGGVMVWWSLCALGVVLWCGCSWREGCRGRWRWCTGQCVRPDAVLVVVAHGVRLLRSWRWCAHLPGLKRSVRVGLCASLAPHTHIYIIGKTKYFNAKTKNSLFLFGSIKIYMYLCSRIITKRINNNKNTRL